jgi:hypothetical protein
MTQVLMTTKSNGVRRLLYTRDVPGKRPPCSGGGGVVKCDAAACNALVHFTSTDGLCLKCWTRSKTERVPRKIEARQEGQRKARATLQKKKERAHSDSPQRHRGGTDRQDQYVAVTPLEEK